MKKHFAFFAVLLIISFSLIFVACDDTENENECTVTFVTSGIESVERYEKTIKKGETVSIEDFIALADKTTKIGNSIYTGLYNDSSCVFKRDDSIPINANTTLYVKKSAEGTPVVNFVLDGKTYSIAVGKTKTVGVFDFISSAYGKSAIPEQFDFFKDERCTEKLELTGFEYKTCASDFWQRYTIYVKKHNVATINFCIHEDGSECASSFEALVRTDETLSSDLFEKLYREYYGDNSRSFENVTFYSNETLENVITVAGELTKIHVNVK